MMKFLQATLLASILALGTTNLYAGAGHDHGAGGHSHDKINETKAIIVAKDMKNELTKQGKLDKSWQSIDLSKTDKKRFGQSEEWVISFSNPQIADKSKQTLYVFVNLYGKVTGANHTGK